MTPAELRAHAESEAQKFGPKCQRHGSDVVLALLDGMEAAREAAGLLYLARKRCACWGKMTGRCMTCDRYRDGEEAISAALVSLEKLGSK